MKIIVCYKHTKTITYNIYKSNHFHHIETLDLILACILGCCHFSTFCRFTLLIKLWQRYSGIFTHVSEITLFIPTHSIFHPFFLGSRSSIGQVRRNTTWGAQSKGIRRLAVFHCTNGALEGLILKKKSL